MADILTEPKADLSGQQTPRKRRLNWLTWWRNSLGSSRNAKKMCSCGNLLAGQQTQNDLQNSSAPTDDWPVFTTQVAPASPSASSAYGCGRHHHYHRHHHRLQCGSSPPSSPLPGGLLPLRPLHLASRCHEEVLYTRLNRSASVNSAGNVQEDSQLHNLDEDAYFDKEERLVVDLHGDVNEARLVLPEDIDVGHHEQEETTLLCSGMGASSTSSGSSSASSSTNGISGSVASPSISSVSSSVTTKSLSKFSSPFRRKPKFSRSSKGKENSSIQRLLMTEEASTEAETSSSSASSSTAITREELLRLFILKLDEEANYFQVTASPEEELCDCPKCQSYYCEYYGRYFEDYERRRREQGAANSNVTPLEASILMDDIMNNGMTFCSIM